MSAADEFEQFLTLRKQASDAFIHGDSGPLQRISAMRPPATIFGPNGDCVQGPENVNATNEKAARLFKHGSSNRFEVIHMAADDHLAYWVGIQRSTVQMQGHESAVRMDLRLTEIFRRDGGGWKLVHRHADKLAAE